MKRLLLAALFIPITAAYAGAATSTVSEPLTGLTVQAPAGFRLSVTGQGVYTLTNGKIFARFMRARSPLTLAKTAASFLKLTKAKVSKKLVSGSKLTYQATVGGKKVTVTLIKAGAYIDVASYGKGANLRSLTVRAAGGLTAAQLKQLQRIVGTRNGGLTAPLLLQIPTKVFQAADGTTATVPNLPGWQYNGGGGGIISGANATQGFFELGVPAVANYPFPGGAIVLPDFNVPTAAQAIAEIYPQYAKVYAGSQVQVTAIQEVAGTDGIFAPSYVSSGLFAIGFTINGQPWEGLMTSATTPLPGAEAIAVLWYHSVIAVPLSGPGGIGPALITTWSTWNHSASDAQRLAQAAATLASIHVSGGPIDPDVFQAAANAWDAYIRGPNED